MEFIQNNGSLFNGVMPVKVTPDFEKTWDYDTSVQKVKVVFAHWKKLTTEMIEELIRARNELSKPGNPYVKTEGGVERTKTWNDYCVEVGINRRTANRWINRYMKPDDLPKQPVKEKEITGDVIVNSVKRKKGNVFEVSLMCPHCGDNFSVELEAA